MTRILFMHQASSVGGGSYCLLNIIKELDREQFEPVVVLQSNGPLVDELHKLGVEVVLFPQMMAVPYNHALTLLKIRIYLKVHLSLRPFVDLLKRINADILYLNNMMIYPYLRVAKEQGMKTVIHVREHWPLDEHVKQLGWARKAVYTYADKLIAINHYSASIFPQKEATIVYDWIDMKGRYKPISMNDIFGEDVAEKKVLLYTGGFQQIKGSDYIVNAFSNEIKGDEYRLLILGADLNKPLKGRRHQLINFLSYFGYNYYEKNLRESIKTDSRIVCIPGVYELVDLVKQSYCFVSYFRIPHANLALAENIILGNPCIAADTEESREYTKDGNFAMLVKPNNPKEFATKLISFLEEREKWKESAQSGSKYLSELFNKDINVQKLNRALLALVS